VPKKPAIIRPVRQIREALGLTQAEMAERLEVFRGTIEKLENGTMKMPADLAFKYRIETGCDLRASGSEGEGEVEVSFTINGKPYSLEGFQSHHEALCSASAEESIASAVVCLRVLLEASQESQSLPQMTKHFEVFVLKSLHDSGLSDAFLKVLRDQSGDLPSETVARISRIVGKGF